MSVIQHLINGEPVTDSGRTADVFNPSTGGDSRCRWPTAQPSSRRSPPPTPHFRPGATRRRPSALRSCSASGSCSRNTRRDRRSSSPRSTARCYDDALGEFQRGIEVVEYACAAPELLKGEHAKNVGPAIDSWSESSRSAWWPASRRSISRQWCRCGCSRWRSCAAILRTEALGAGPERLARDRAAVSARRACRMACSTWLTATSKRSTRC